MDSTVRREDLTGMQNLNGLLRMVSERRRL